MLLLAKQSSLLHYRLILIKIVKTAIVTKVQNGFIAILLNVDVFCFFVTHLETTFIF